MNLANFAPARNDFSLERASNTFNQLVTLREGGNRAPLFCIHPAGGDVGIYRKLVTRLAAVRPVYGIQSRMLTGQPKEMASLQEMATTYAQIIQTKQPLGEVFILGFSLGGFIATLIARELRKADRKVAFLGLIDSNPNWTAAADIQRSELYLRMEQVFTKFQAIGMLKPKPIKTVQRDVIDLVDICLSKLTFSSTDVMAKIADMGYLPTDVREVSILANFASVFLSHCRLLAGFTPNTIDCALHLWWPSENVPTINLWQPHAKEEIIESIVTGSHYSIMRGPTVRGLAGEIDIAIGNVEVLPQLKTQ